ncbi:MAG: GntR family transcriptional regulator [Phyllobacterium sp.]|uniref:GntR family transcriptional regulator n=1 Tax=Phyllobacterium sp. TaxID=1871046 RepID=UPI0030F2A81C
MQIRSAKLARKKEIIRSGTTVEQMVRSIADLIITGAMHPGERLDEISLANRFEVSRTPVREALSQLCASGLVCRQPNKSAIVTNVTQKHLASMFEAMAELEAVCARLSAERMTVDERRMLDAEHTASARLVYSRCEDEYEAHNIEFHTRLYRGAHSEHLAELANQTRARLAPFRRAQFRIPGRLARSYQEHDVVVTAILRADGPAASLAAYTHVSIVSTASTVFADTGTD